MHISIIYNTFDVHVFSFVLFCAIGYILKNIDGHLLLKLFLLIFGGSYIYELKQPWILCGVGFGIGYLFNDHKDLFDFSDWLRTYRYNKTVKSSETRRTREDDLVRKRNEEQRRREAEQQQARTQQEQKNKKQQQPNNEKYISDELKRKEDELRRKEEELKKRADSIEEIIQRSYQAGRQSGQKDQQNNKQNQKRNNHDILGLKPGFAKSDLERAWRELRSIYHPDKLASKSEPVRRRMEEEFKEIKRAYEELSK